MEFEKFKCSIRPLKRTVEGVGNRLFHRRPPVITESVVELSPQSAVVRQDTLKENEDFMERVLSSLKEGDTEKAVDDPLGRVLALEEGTEAFIRPLKKALDQCKSRQE